MIASYKNSELHCEAVPLSNIAKAVGTPTYVYSQQLLTQAANDYLASAGSLSTSAGVYYSVKANGNPSILRLFAELGMGADVTSGGELFLAMHAGFPAHRIVYSGVGKSRAELIAALEAGIAAIHIESVAEFELLAALTAEQQQMMTIAIRINPNVAAKTHPYISTGKSAHKFGVNIDLALALLRRAHAHQWLKPAGIAAHIGSQIVDLAPFEEAVGILLHAANSLQQEGIQLDYIDIGGGLGIDYTEQSPPISAWVEGSAGPIVAAGYGVKMEPGRSIVGPAGLLLTQVVYTKEQGEKGFVVTDAGMSDLIRPTLYQAHHPILPVSKPKDSATKLVDIVGPICETGDFLARDRHMPAATSGELLAVTHAGAYGFAMSSNYNGRLRPAEVMVSGDQFTVIRRRQTLDSLLDGCVGTT